MCVQRHKHKKIANQIRSGISNDYSRWLVVKTVPGFICL